MSDISSQYRLVRRKYHDGVTRYAIHEVFTNDRIVFDESRDPDAVCQKSVVLIAESPTELVTTIDKIKAGLSLPILDFNKDFDNV